MKFCKAGPDIPDHLLWERDAGKVAFICGAGVSSDTAGLPDFLKLTSLVMDTLKTPQNNDAWKILALANKPETIDLVPIDRIFSELEKEHGPSLVEKAISEHLTIQDEEKLKSHEIIRKLATTPQKKLKLITTNFDNLFTQELELQNIDYSEHVGPDLPDLEIEEDFNGLIYLHGKCSNKVEGASNLVLSTSTFGKAYLADGWATKFLKDILKYYTVVFVGYQANDPPMQYLLEALAVSFSESTPQKIYAFQEGDSSDLKKRWKNKGVTSICYSNYGDLWRTLDLWSERAQSIDGWMSKILKLAEDDPRNLKDWQRSQVVHLASHPSGARAIANKSRPISPKWLFCIDSKLRFSTPRLTKIFGKNEEYFDFLSQYRLAEDDASDLDQNREMSSERVAPNSALDALKILPIDIQNSKKNNNFSTISCDSSKFVVEMPTRLESLSVWIAKVSHCPETLRWAIHHSALHPFLRQEIESHLYHRSTEVSPIVIDAWELLFETYDSEYYSDPRALARLRRQVGHHNWSDSRVQKYRKILSPRLKISNAEINEGVFNSDITIRRLEDIIELDISYLDSPLTFDVPDNWVGSLLGADRENLLHAIELEKRLGIYGNWNLPPISKPVDMRPTDVARTVGKNAIFFRYLSRFKRLLDISRNKAIIELGMWPQDDTNIFSRLRIWVAGNTDLMNISKIGDTLSNLDPAVFWNIHHRRDLLHALRSRWNALPTSSIRKIEKIILKGSLHDGDGNPEFDDKGNHESLNILQWLKDNHCKFTFNFEDVILRLMEDTQNWSPKHARDADKSFEPRDYPVRIGSKYNERVLDDEERNIYIESSDALKERYDNVDSFSKLCISDPWEAFAKLLEMSRRDSFPEWAWSRWLMFEGRESASSRFLIRTTTVLLRAPVDQIEKLRFSIFPWFRDASKNYRGQNVNLRNTLFRYLLHILSRNSDINFSNIVRQNDGRIDWIFEFANSPAGQLADSLFNRAEVSNFSQGNDLPDDWLKAAVNILSLEDDGGRYALVSFMYRLQWLYHFAPSLVKKNILTAVDSNQPMTVDAFWSGLARVAPKISDANLYGLIKEKLIRAVTVGIPMDGPRYRGFSLLLVRGWLNRNVSSEMISDEEFSEVILNVNETLVLQVLSRFRQLLSEEYDESDFNPYAEIEHLFESVWPRYRVITSRRVVNIMVQIATSNSRIFSTLVPIFVSRFGSIDNFVGRIFRGLLQRECKILREDPEIVLDVLYSVSYPEEKYKILCIDDILKEIREAAPGLAKDHRFSYLKN